MTQQKNWLAISEIGPEHLRLAFVAAKGETAEKLAMGFPECFVPEGVTHPVLSRDALFRLVGSFHRKEDLLEALKASGIPHHRFCFEGSNRGIAEDGVPYAKGGYNTTANGWANYFWRSTRKTGEEVSWADAKWLVVWNIFSPGAAEYFAVHNFIIVPADSVS